MGLAILETFKTLEEAEIEKKKYIEDGWNKDRLFIFDEPDENKEEPYCLCVD